VGGALGIGDWGAENDTKGFVFVIVDDAHQLGAGFFVTVEESCAAIFGNVLLFYELESMGFLGSCNSTAFLRCSKAGKDSCGGGVRGRGKTLV